MQKLTRYNTGFTMIEVLASMGILITFLTATLVSFTATRKLSEGSQQQVGVLQEAKAKLEEMRAMDFRDLRGWYDTIGTDSEDFDNDNNTTEDTYINRWFTLYDEAGDKNGLGSIVLIDVYDDDPALRQAWLGEYDDAPAPVTGDNWTRATAVAGWSARTAHSSVVFNNRMWVLGGYSGSNRRDVWSSTDGATWTQATATAGWSARTAHSSVVFNNRMWVLGGYDGSSYLNDVWSSTDGATWTQATATAGWSVRMDHASVVLDNKIWVLGGMYYDGSLKFLNDVWYSADGATWTQATAAAGWVVRAAHSSVVFNNRMWVLGGNGGVTSYNDVWSSTDGATWTQATAAAGWGTRQNHTSVVLDGRMWVLGGNRVLIYLDDFWSSTDGATWTQATAAAGWGQRTNHASVDYAGKIFALGGYDGSSRFRDVWWSYGAERMYQADITISWRDKEGRITGEDNGGDNGQESAEALNGIIDAGEDADADGILDSPAHVTGLLVNRGYPQQIYLGRP